VDRLGIGFGLGILLAVGLWLAIRMTKHRQFASTDGRRNGRPSVPLIAGELDSAVPVEDARDLGNAFPREGTRFQSFAGAGPILAFEHPEPVMNVIREFVLEDL
jgi:hypothetical protein